ncbi:uncharacterized protein CDV56_102063 [Aspergillus thermomutatus]|uniref:Uncharacterized protein n=1 Tax=Aspergillus thermomutatus TaxID=41047 RepID=A0A397FY99_ASPTH|nr:uncharacterized protein CDV56_102063 [Aspergillus thermomutatus]RHZ43732.1 hypothetical protein CDV56_102063 [Aspergillus thermomutatus]
MSIPAAPPELEQSVRQLSLSDNAPIKDIPRPIVKTPSAKKKPPIVADSWEDEADSDPSLSEIEQSCPSSAATPDPSTLSPSVSVSAEGPLDPPPTPISPQTSQPWVSSAPLPGRGLSSSPSRGSGSRSPVRRPEKQTAVAGRLIAGALGIRAPKRTEEQRAYDRAVKEQEIRRRNREREEEAKRKEAEERAKAAIWDE